MNQTDLAQIILDVPNRDWLLYRKELGATLDDLDNMSIMIIVADQSYKRETGRHDLNRFLDMSFQALGVHLGQVLGTNDEPVTE